MLNELIMIECRVCRTNNINNTIFCEECGNYLLRSKSRETDRLDTVNIGWIGKQTNGHRGAARFQTDRPLLIICLKIVGSKREVELVLNTTITLGRIDPALDIFPEVDLTYEGNLSRMVSRRHASILWQERTVLVEDLASGNGTFLNGKRLVPFLPETLGDGDILQLGKLLIEVKIKEQ